LVLIINRIDALAECSDLVCHGIHILNASMYPVIVIGLHDHSSWKSLRLSYLLPESCTPTENLSVDFAIAVAKTHIDIPRLQDLHIALETHVILPREVIIVFAYLIGARR
jgi:hypothetical protein